MVRQWPGLPASWGYPAQWSFQKGHQQSSVRLYRWESLAQWSFQRGHQQSSVRPYRWESLAQWFLSGDTRGIFYCIIFTCLKLFYITVSYWMGDLLAMHTNNSQLVEAKTDSLRQHLHVNMCCTLHSGQSKGWRSVKCQAYRWNLSTK